MSLSSERTLNNAKSEIAGSSPVGRPIFKARRRARTDFGGIRQIDRHGKRPLPTAAFVALALTGPKPDWNRPGGPCAPLSMAIVGDDSDLHEEAVPRRGSRPQGGDKGQTPEGHAHPTTPRSNRADFPRSRSCVSPRAPGAEETRRALTPAQLARGSWWRGLVPSKTEGLSRELMPLDLKSTTRTDALKGGAVCPQAAADRSVARQPPWDRRLHLSCMRPAQPLGERRGPVEEGGADGSTTGSAEVRAC